jgi:hypothetical protein
MAGTVSSAPASPFKVVLLLGILRICHANTTKIPDRQSKITQAIRVNTFASFLRRLVLILNISPNYNKLSNPRLKTRYTVVFLDLLIKN